MDNRPKTILQSNIPIQRMITDEGKKAKIHERYNTYNVAPQDLKLLFEDAFEGCVLWSFILWKAWLEMQRNWSLRKDNQQKKLKASRE